MIFRLKNSVALQLGYDGWWETLADGCMEYMNTKEYNFFGSERLYI